MLAECWCTCIVLRLGNKPRRRIKKKITYSVIDYNSFEVEGFKIKNSNPYIISIVEFIIYPVDSQFIYMHEKMLTYVANAQINRKNGDPCMQQENIHRVN